MDFNEALALGKSVTKKLEDIRDQVKIAKTGWTDEARVAAMEARRRANLHGAMNEHHEVESEKAHNNGKEEAMDAHDRAGDEHRLASSDFSRSAEHYDRGNMRRGDKLFAHANKTGSEAFALSAKAHAPD